MAAYFGKEHKNVLRDIDNLGCSPDFRALNFELTVIRDRVGATTRHIRTFDMTKDGFTFLVMGFTGRKADTFKERYIQEFNRMEEELKARTPSIPQTYAEALQLAADQAKQIEAMKPQAQVGQTIASTKLRITDAAGKLSGVHKNKVQKTLGSLGYLRKVDGGWRARSYQTKNGKQTSKRVEGVYFQNRSNPHTGFNVIEVLPKGWELLVDLYLNERLEMRQGCAVMPVTADY